MKAQLLLPIILTILMVFPMNSNAAEAWAVYESFENSDSITNHGWEIYEYDITTGFALTTSIASAVGTRGLHLSSLGGVYTVGYAIEIPYNEQISIDFQVFDVQNGGTVRVTFNDINYQPLQLDYGPSISGWEEGGVIYDIASPFVEGGWVGINRDFQADINQAIEDPDSPFTDYQPYKLSSIEIFQDADGGAQRELYIDEIKIIMPPAMFLEPEVTTVTLYNTQYQTIESPYGQNSNNSPSTVLGWFLFFTTLLIFAINKFGKPQATEKKKLENIIDNTLINKCPLCGLVNETDAMFCGNCGHKILE